MSENVIMKAWAYVAIILLVCASCLAIGGEAVSESDYDIDAFGIITKYNGQDSDIVIPGEINGIPVTGIGESAFEECGSITSVAVSEGVMNIGEKAFAGCKSLKSIALPGSIKSIDSMAFHNDASLCSVYAASLESWLSIAFADNSANPTQYADNLFCGGILLAEVTIPDDTQRIPDYAFFMYEGLTKLTIPEGVAQIGESAFAGCSNLKTVEMPERMTSIGKEAFADCSELTSLIIPEGITIVEPRTFANCGKLISVRIPDSVYAINPDAFSGSDKVVAAADCGSSALDCCLKIGVATDVVNHGGKLIKIITAQPACTEKGFIEKSYWDCCGTVEQEQAEIPALGHTEVIDDAVDATCTTTGKTEGKHCFVCNEVLVRQT
ncbi:MAG: leucine-rich repeat domain-containing protein, partial [Clostridia bacterium]|nr:leucine-rich repeat domain-containing protein [Clostridia bacterium]